MLCEIRQYVRDTGLKLVAVDCSLNRSFGFETDCTEFNPKHRLWRISFIQYLATAKVFDVFLDGERVQHPAQEEILRRYLEIWHSPEGRAIIAQALTTGKHPPPRRSVLYETLTDLHD
jgi:hypothetical protein